MNLRELIQKLKLTETEAMNLLQSEGVISDNTVALADVSNADQKRAVEWFKTKYNAD